MQDKNKIPMVSSEIASFWSSYMSDSLAKCVLKYFLAKMEDEEMKLHIQEALSLSEQHIQTVTNFFNEEGLPIPYGASLVQA